MAVPKRRPSPSKQAMRRSHDALKPPSQGRCKHCQQAVLPHRICPNCGWYRGRRAVLEKEGG